LFVIRDIFDEDLGPPTEAEKKRMKETKVFFKQVIEKSSDTKTDLTYLFFSFLSFSLFCYLKTIREKEHLDKKLITGMACHKYSLS
jgi:hypothetical protein